MPRTLWSGSLSFGLVSVPVQLVSAARDLDLHFHQLHEKDKKRIEQRRYCSEEEVEVGWEEVARSFDLDGKQVVITDEELGSVEPRKTRTIEIEAFVDRADVDPIYFDHPYFLIPAGEADGTMRAYRLLAEVMDREGRIALGRFVMRTKEYLAAIRVRDGALELSTVRFADEIRDPGDVPTGGRKPSRKQLDNAIAVIEELSTEWDPTSYRDCYRERLEHLIERKRKGAKIEPPQTESEPKPASDLMAALEQTLANVRDGRDPRAEPKDDGSELDDLSREELYERAQDAGIKGRSTMSRNELRKALEHS